MTELEKMIAEFDRQNANLSDDRQEEVPTESPKTNEWGEPVYSFEEPVEVEGARLNDFLIPTIFKQKSNAKSETALPKATKEEKPYNPEGLLPIAESGQAEMPQSFISPKVFKEFTPEEKLMLDVDKATDNAFGVVQQEASAQSVNEELSKTPWQRAFENDTYEATKNQVSLRQTTGADAVIKRTFESISADDINSIIESRVANNEEFKAKKQAFDDEVKRIMPNSNDNLSDAEVKALFANMTPEEREAAEKQIAETTQALEALQTRFATDVEGIYKSESKDVEAQINNRIINRLAKLNLPKNDLEYIGKAIYNNSLVGTLYEIGVNAAAGGSGTDYIVSQQALAQAKPSAIAKVVGGAGAILADGAIFGALGAGGSLTGVGVRELATQVVAGQIARKAAVSATNSAVKTAARRIVEKNVLQQFASSAIAQSLTLGGYNGLLTAAQETLSPTGENGAYNWRNILTRFGEGFATGIALGGVSVGTSAAKGAMYRARPDMAYTATGMAADLGVSLAGFTAENAAFLGIGSIVSGEEITAEAIGESFATLGLLKGIGALKRVAKGEKLMQQPDFVERTISDLKFTKEEMDAMRKAGVDMEQMDIISEAVREVTNSSVNTSQIAQEAISQRPLMEVYNSVMSSREVPISAKAKLQYIVKGTIPRSIGATSLTISDTNGTPTVKAYDINGRLVQIREFANRAEAELFMKKTQPLLERNTIIEGEKVLRGGQIAVTMQQAIEQYAKENPNTDARALFTELMIDLGYVKGEVPTSSRERVDAIKSRIKEQFVDPASQLVDGIARKYGTTAESVYRALNIKPDLRTVRESQLVKAYVDGLKQFSESMSGPVEAEQARYAEQVRPQIEQGKREVEDAERETAFVRESLNEAAKRMATEDGKQIAIVRLATGEQVAVYKGRIVTKENGTIDTEASENTVVIKRIDAEGNEVRNQVGIGEIAEVVEFSTPEATIEESMSVVEAQAAKKLSLDNAIAERGEQGVEVVTIDGNSGKIVGIDENGAYILRAKGESGKEVDVPVSINDIAEINTEQPVPATTEQIAVADATEKVVEAGLATDVEVEYDDDFPPLTEEDMAPAINPDNIQWDKLSQEEYADVSAMVMGDATTLADSHIYYTNSRGKLQAAQRKVAEQQKVIDKLNSRFATLSSPAEAQKLRKQVATAEQEKAKREQAVKNIEQQMAKYAYAMKKYGVEVATENDLLAEREKLNAERAALVEADKELDQAEADAEKNIKKTIPNTEANRKYIEQLYADRLGVSPAQAGPRQAILWDLANGAIKLRWDNVTTDSGAVQRGLQAELGVRGTEERRAHKAVIDNKNGQSVDAYVHDLWQNGEWGQEISTEELKDELLGVLQSTPNGSLALKELADMSGAQADLEARISLGKGDIQRKLEEIDANLAKNAQQMADFRKRINDTMQKLENGEPIESVNSVEKNAASSERNNANSHNSSSGSLLQKGNARLSGEPLTPNEDVAKVSRKTEIAKNAIRKIINSGGIIIEKDTVERAVAAVGNGLHMDKSKSSQSFYDDYYEGNYSVDDNVLHLRISTHPATDTRMGNNPADHKVSIVIRKNGEHKDTGEHNGYEEIVYEPSEVTPTEAANAIVKGVQSLLETGKYVDITGKAHTTIYPSTTIPENQISEEEIFNTPTLPTNEDIPFMIEPTAKTSSNGFVPTPKREITYDNFYERTGAVFSQVERPNREPDYISQRTMQPDKVSSEYWYGEDEGGKYVVRGSDHWSTVAKRPETVETIYKSYVNRKYVPSHNPLIGSCWWGLVATDSSQPILYGKAYLNDINDLTHDRDIVMQSRIEATNKRFNREVFDAFAGHLGETLGAESVVTDAAEAQRVLEWHQAVGERLRTAVRENAEIAAERAEIERVAKENGTWLKAPNGKDTNLTERQWIDVRTSRFKSWFGDWENDPANASKVVDANGEPMVVYHGTSATFNVFDSSATKLHNTVGDPDGFYFTDSIRDAQNFAFGSVRQSNGDWRKDARIVKVFLNLRNPIDATEAISKNKRRKKDKRLTYSEAKRQAYSTFVEGENDGYMLINPSYWSEYVVLSPNQIKSATENTGEYNPANDDIRMSIEAYHGSGADFEKFDHSFMGTGEGAQAFGYGTYVTTRRGIAKNYADTIGGTIQEKRRYEAEQNLLTIRKEIADNNRDIQLWRRMIEGLQSEIAACKDALSTFIKEEVGGEVRYIKDPFYIEADEVNPIDLATPSIPTPDGVSYLTYEEVQKNMQQSQKELSEYEIRVNTAQARVNELLPLEQAAEKEWQAVTVSGKIDELTSRMKMHQDTLLAHQTSLAASEKRLEIKTAERDWYNEELSKLEKEYGKNSPEYKNFVFNNDYIEEEYQSVVKSVESNKRLVAYSEEQLRIEENTMAELKKIQPATFRNLYTVEVPDNTGDNYLSWDKEVPATMIERINNYIKENYGWKAHSEADLKQGMTGKQVYDNLTRAWGKQAGASLLLSDIGFTGIEYPAQYTTGGRADGAKNYVIFNADDVKIVDHVQYFKTPNGEVYGFVYEDKIYLDPTNIDPKAPVHEYTELWCREVAKANEALWKRGKELVKQTPVWEEVNADENYKNQSEDLRASEAWSRIIADEMMGKAREYGSKGLMAKLRGWLRSFWKTVKSVVGKWTKKDLDDLTVDQFKKMTMADFINKVDPRKWNAKKPKEVSKSLVGIHNISLDKLQKALKQGGLANPSAAVIDIAKGDHFEYGEYSFIMPKSLVDKKSGRNIGTFDRDAWTPLYPSVEYSHNEESRKNLNKLVEGLDEGLADKIKGETLAKVNGNGFYSGLQIVFLKERGVEVPIASKAGKFFGTIEEFKQLFGDKEPTYENYQALDKAQKDEVTLWIRAKGMPEEIARYKELLVKPARKEGLWNFLLDDVGYGKFDQAVYGLQADARNAGTPDYEKTIDNAVNYIRENGLQEEFDAWQSETINNLGFDERIQVGISPSGDRIMRKNTLENVSKYMRRQGKNASADHWSNSEGKMLAQLVQNFSSLDKIRANKWRLRGAADDVVGIRKRINEMAQVFMNFAKHTDLFMEEQSALAYLEDILVGGMDPDKVVAEFNAATKRNVTLTEEQKAEMKQLREDMKSIPVQYFETKFERPVMFNEFAAVVAPDTMPESVEQQLRDAGLAIYKYNPDVEGDRRKATLAATASEDIRFMIVGEKGAAALDQAEEATTRLDNLAVAREMEEANRDAKAIKLATGWERGADGKWRYEIDDFKLKSDTALVKNVDNQIVTTLGEVIDDETLFTAFPELRKLSVVSLPNQEYGGHYQDDSIMPHIALGNKLFTPSTKRLVELEKEFDKDMNSEQEDALMSEFNAEVERAVAQPEFYTLVTSAAKKVLVHEVQHAIQRIEGFARGGSWEIERPDNDAEMLRLREAVRGARAYIDHFNGGDIAMAIRDGKKYNYLEWRTISPESQQILLEYLGRKRKVDYADFRAYLDNAHKMTLPKKYGMAGYRKFAGEVESKNAEARMYMTPEERRATLLSETEDVAREDQIFLENNLGVAQSVEVSESVEAPTRKPRKSAAEKSLEKIESLREQLKNKKRSLNDTLLDVYNFLTSKDIAETMGEGVGKAQYRRVIKNSIEAIRKAYDVTDAEEKRKTIFKYLGEIDDSLSQLLTRQRLNEVTDILDKAIYGYTAQGVRTGKRIDEHTREIFDILRNAIGEPVEEERDDNGRRKPVRYRLKNRTEAGDITSSFRLRSVGNNEGVIAKLRSEADDIIASADELDTATTRAAAQLEYASNLLSLYDNALQLNEAIGHTTDEIADIQREIERTNEQYKAAATGSEEKKNLYKMRQKLQNDLEAEQMNRAALRHRYASMLKTFTTSLEELDEKGAGDFARAEMAKAEQAVKWRRGIYKSIKNPNAPVLPREDYDRQGKEIKVNWKGLNTRAKINESAFMATFAEMSRDIDINSIPGQWAKDGWYYQFMLSEGGYMARTDWRYKQEVALREELDAEVLKLSGDKKADEPYKLFAQLAQEPSGLVIPRLSVGKNKEGKTVGGYQDNIPLTIGQILYMRNAIRQPNGYAGYLAWGIPEEDMKKIAQYAEANYPKYCRFFDWVVSEFMPKLYEMQDAIYFEKFGTHLPKTAFYFPFVRDKRMVGKVAEVGEGEVSLPSSVTGNIVERVKTSAKMDLQADAFSVLQDHIKETLDWCAYVELTDKFNSLATSHAFGNMLKAQGVSVQKLKEMYEIAIGQGKINSTDNTTLTKTLNAISKGLVAGNIVLNLNSAAKQLVSGSCALGYTANPKIIPIWAKNFFVPSAIKTGVGKLIQQIKSGALDPVEVVNWKAFADNWKWAIENIPTLRERWEGRNVGFEVLKSHSFESWDKLSSIITKFGLAPNATIDMFTCANVAKTVYEYEYPRLLERGRSKEEAHREACVKAAIFTNETQQSGIDAFLSSFQSGVGLQRILGVGLGAYQNTSMAFARNERFALTNMLRMLNPATREQMIAHQVKAYKELGVEDKKARELAKSDFKESQGQQFSAFIHNGIVSNLLWTLAGTLLTTAISGGIAAMFGGKDEWEKMKNNEKFREELSSALSIETIAWQTPLFYNAPIFKQLLTYAYNASKGKTYGGIFESPSSQSAQELIDAIFKQWIGVKNEVTGERERKEPTRYDRTAEWLLFSTFVKAGLGVNPDLVVRMAEGVNDMMKDGVQVEDVMNVLSSPRGLTRAIAGEPRPGESKQEYLDRMSYIYRQVNAGSGEYDKKFVSERTKEYIDNKDDKLYRELGIVPREVRILEQRVKAIRKQLLFFDKSDEGIAEFKALPETERKQQIEIAKRYDKVFALTRKMNQGILPFDEDGMSKRREELQQRYDMLKQVYDMWIEYNNK
ncbi:MAG: hypothetical protein IKJ08_07200 [Alistipes sp.]|nr:hypothetical protein [Alistipes sp.]